MTYHTRYLDVLTLAATSFPAGVVPILLAAIGDRSVHEIQRRSLGTYSLVLAVCVILVRIVDHRDPWLILPLRWNDYLIGLLCGLLSIAIEYSVGVLWKWRGNRSDFPRVQMNPLWQVRMSAPAVAMCLAVVVLEEVVYRQIWLGTLIGPLHVGVAFAVGASAVVFAVNHVQLGWITVTAKVCSGLLYGWLFVVCGMAITVPVLAHGVHNLLLMVLLPQDGEES